MSKSVLLDMVAGSRRMTIMHEEDGKHFVESRQDIAPIVKAAQELWQDKPPKDMRRVALIPDVVLNRAFNEGWFHDETAWKRWANDPANAHLRTTKGTI